MMTCTRYILLFVAVLGLAGTAVMAADQTINTKSGLVEKVKGGYIDWGKEMYYASGEGAMPPASEEPNRARALLKAKGYARMQAIANLLMAVEGTPISYEAFGKDYMAQSEVLKQKIEGFVKNVEVIKMEKAKIEGQTVVRVIVGTHMYGNMTPGNALLSSLAEEVGDTGDRMAEATAEKSMPKLEPVAPANLKVEVKIETTVKATPKTQPKVEPKIAPKVEPKVEPKEEQKSATMVIAEEKPEVKAEVVKSVALSEVSYTSVIVDTTGFKVSRAMSPKIRTKDGGEVWGTLKMDPDVVQDRGPVAYARSLGDAKKCPRAGSSPLLINAIGRAGGARMCDVVLSDDDAAKLRDANDASKPPFLDQMAVVFVVDPIKL
ncbi:MAG: hypothetical protein M1133_11220 [Armatimonadetes bacterium]|nr:hypothetical protein [Armatimonadota bacterium]